MSEGWWCAPGCDYPIGAPGHKKDCIYVEFQEGEGDGA